VIKPSRESEAFDAAAAAELNRYDHLSSGNLWKNRRNPASQRRTLETKSSNGVQSPRVLATQALR
jgi:hypothetical protein